MTGLVLVPLAGLAAAWASGLVIRRIAPAWGLVDRPDDYRKDHARAVPLGGGIAVAIGVASALAMALLVGDPLTRALGSRPRELAGLACAGLFILAVGLIDDRLHIRGRQKLAGQLVAALILVLADDGLVIRSITVFDTQMDLGLLAFPFTLFWLIGAVNALNLIDGIDGLASTVGAIIAATVTVMAFLNGHPAEAVVALALCASCLGFLIVNFPPASIFLGDAGSMFVGLLAGALAIRSSIKGAATVVLLAPIAVWAIPVFDCAAAILRRRLTGRSIYAVDHGHLHHCLLRRGLTNVAVLALITGMCATTALGALASVYWHNELFALFSVVAVATVLIATHTFGYVEFAMLASRCKSLTSSLLHAPGGRGHAAEESSIQLQGSVVWDELWRSVISHADELHFHRVRLDLNLPLRHEGYHATWQRNGEREDGELWQVGFPLVHHGVRVGRLEVCGERNGQDGGSPLLSMPQVVDALELRLATLLDHAAAGPHGVSAVLPSANPVADRVADEVAARAGAGLPPLAGSDAAGVAGG